MTNEQLYSLFDFLKFEDENIIIDRDTPIPMLKEKLAALLVYRATGFLSDAFEDIRYKDGESFFYGSNKAAQDYYEVSDERYLFAENSLYRDLVDKFCANFKGTSVEEAAIFIEELQEAYYDDKYEEYLESHQNLLEEIGVTYSHTLHKGFKALRSDVFDILEYDPAGEMGPLILYLVRSEELGALLSGDSDDIRVRELERMIMDLPFKTSLIDGVFYAYIIYGCTNNGYTEEENPLFFLTRHVARFLMINRYVTELLNEEIQDKEVPYAA